MLDRKNIEDIRPLNHTQNSILINHIKNPDGLAYIHHLCFDVNGKFDVDRFQRAYKCLVQKYSVLRSVLLYQNIQKAVQVVMKSREINMTCILSAEECIDEATEQLLLKENAKLNKLENAFLFDISVIGTELNRSKTRIVFSFHHIILDGWSLGLLISDLFNMYHVEDQYHLETEHEQFSFMNYLNWKKKNQIEEVSDSIRKMLGDSIEMTGLSPQLSGSHAFVEKNCAHLLRGELYKRIEVFCRNNEITTNAFYLGIWAILLAKYNCTDKVSFGTVLSGRNGKVPEIESAVGLFIQTVPVVVDVHGDHNALEVMKEINAISLDYMQHPCSADYGQENGGGVYNHVVAFENYPIADLLVNQNDRFGIKIDNIQYYGYTNFEFGLSMTPISGEAIELAFKYNGNSYTESYFNTVFDCYCHIAETVVKKDVAICKIALTDDDVQKKAFLCDLYWDETETVVSRLNRICMEEPESKAICDSYGVLTYEDLNKRSNAVAHALQKAGIGKGDIVAVFAERRAEFIVGMIGVLKTGAAYLPVNKDFAKGRMYQYLDSARVTTVLVQDMNCAELLDREYQIFRIDQILNTESDTSDPDTEIAENNLAYVIYTSGSTGKPKGIGITHKNIINLVNGLTDAVYSRYQDTRDHFNVGVITSFMFDASVKQIYGALLNGHTLCIASEIERSSGRNILDFYTRAEIDISDGTPTHLRLLLQDMSEGESISVKEFLVGGEQLTKDLAKALFDRAQREGELVLSNVYGPSECCVDSTIFSFNNIEQVQDSVVPIGRPLKNYQVIIVDNNGYAVPCGVKGEMVIGGPSVSEGYLGNKEETDKSFFVNPYSEGQRLYRTGDIVKELPDGTYEFVGRADNQIKLNGYRMEIDEIEHCIFESGAVRNAAVVARKNDNGSQYLCAFYEGGNSDVEHALRDYLKLRLPDYMIPSHFIQLEEMPVNSNGKIDKKQLKTMEIHMESKCDTFEEAETGLQDKLCRIFEHVLKVDRVGINSDFYELGGTSINAINIVSEIYKETQIYVSPRSIFEYPIVKDLAEQISFQNDKESWTIVPRENEFCGKASSEQTRIYALTHDDPGEKYHIQQGYEFKERMDLDVLSDCLRKLVRKYESLRTSFVTIDGEVMQKVSPDVVVNCNVTEGATITDEWIQDAFKKLREPYDLEKGYLCRFWICQGSEKTVLLFDAHHIIMDGESTSILFHDLFDMLNGKESDKPLYHMIDYSNWQSEYCRSDDYKRKKEYFENLLSDAVECVILPDNKARKDQVARTACIQTNVGSKETQDLLSYANGQRVTLNMLMMAAFSILLSKYTYLDDITFGTVTANRKNIHFSNAVGMFVNTLVFRCHPEKEKLFSDYLHEIKQQMISLVDNEEYLFQDLIRLEGIPSNPVHVLFVMEKNTTKEFEENAGVSRVLEPNYADAKFDLAFYCEEREEGMQIRVEYVTDLYCQNTIETLVSSYLQLLSCIPGNPDLMIRDIEIANSEQSDLILNQFNNTKRLYHFESSLQEMFQKAAHVFADLSALKYGERSLSYKELDLASNAYASELVDFGAQPGEIVAIYLEDKLLQIIAILSILKAGCAYMPIDIEYPDKRIEYMIKDSGTRIVLTENRYKKDERIAALCQVILDSQNLNPMNTNSSFNAVKRGGNDPAYLMYTSGTTGQPKGVIIKHKNVIRLVDNTNFMEFPIAKTMLQTSSIVFDASTLEIWGCLLNGMCLILTRKEEVLDAESVKQYIQKEHIYALWLSAPLFNQLSRGNETMFQGVKWLLVGGDRLPAAQVNAVREQNDGLHVINGYGPTENTTFSTTFDIDDYYDDIPIGYPIANSTVYILDQSGKLLPVGAVGEICVGGDGVGQGYLNTPVQEKFVEDPFSDNAILYRTGDLGRWNEKGYVEFFGRKDKQVKIRGFRVEVKEIEHTVANHEKIRECLVDVREKNGIKYLVLFYVGDISRKELMAYLKSELPEYMRPTHIIELQELPLNANGKIDYSVIRSIKEPESIEDDYVAPRNQVEEDLCEIWSNFFGRANIGVTDNYYDLGGDSLTAIKLLAEINSRENVKLSFKDIMTNPTIESLAHRIEKTDSIDLNEDDTLLSECRNEFSIQQERIMNATMMEPSSNAYNVFCKCKVHGDLEENRFRKAVDLLLETYPILTNVYSYMDNSWHCETDTSVDRVKFVNLSADKVEEYEEKWNCPIRITEKDSLCEFCIVKTGDKDESILLLKVHHSIADGISVDILLQKLAEAYTHGSINSKSAEYSQYIAYQEKIRKDRSIEKQARFWKDLFCGKTELLDLPTDYMRPQMLTYEGNTVSEVIDSDLRECIIAFGQKYQITTYVLLLVAYQVLWYRYSDQSNISIGIFHSGRLQPQFDETIGMFVNTLPMKFELKESVEECMKNTMELFLNAVENSDYTYEDILHEVEYEHAPNRNPLFDVTFSYFSEVNQYGEDDEGLVFEQLPIDSNTSKFDLSFDVRDDGSTMQIAVCYRTSLFRETTINRMLKGYLNILRSICENQVASVSKLSLYSETDKEKIKRTYIDQQIKYKDEIFLDMLYQWKDAENQIAFRTSETEISYAELIRRAERMSSVLYGKGVRENDVVCVIADASIDLYIVYLGIMMLGAAFLPIDVKYPNKRISYILNDIDPKVVVYEDGIDLSGISSEYRQGDESVFRGLHQLLSENPDVICNMPIVAGDTVAYVIYTSGSTGTPKGVMIEHKALANLCHWHNRQYEVTKDTVTMKYAGIGFDASIWEVFPYLGQGATICIPSAEIKLDLEKLNQFISENDVSIAFLPTQIFEEYMQLPNPSLKKILTGGDKLKRFTPGNYELYNNYGPTENCVVSTSYLVTEFSENIPIGKPVDNCRVYILNKDRQLQPTGIPGELYVAGSSLARGYVGLEEMNRELFVEDILFPEERMYRTGDWGKYLDDGNILFLGRKDSQVKIRGNRIELAEIQGTIMAYDLVSDAIVKVASSDTQEHYLIAYVIPKSGYDREKLYDMLRRSLPYYMVPAYVIEVENFVLNANGKVDFSALPKPTEVITEIDNRSEMTAKETLIHNIWKKEFGVESIGLKKDFFRIGGDSIKAMRILFEIQKTVTKQLAIIDMYQCPTIEMLAARCDELMRNDDDVLVVAENTDTGEVTPQEKSMLVMASYTGNSIAYNEPMVYELHRDIDMNRLENAICKLLARHCMLCSVYDIDKGEIVRNRVFADNWPIKHIKDVAFENLDETFQNLIEPFEVYGNLLYRIYLIETTEADHKYLLWDCHHAIADGFSRIILQRELEKVYQNETLPDKCYDYDSYTHWLMKRRMTDSYLNMEHFWKDTLKNLRTEELWENKDTDTGLMNGRSLEFEFDVKLAAALEKIAAEKSVSLYVVLLSIYFLVLIKETQKDDLIVGCADANRERAEFQEIVGMFINMLPIRMKCSGEQTYEDFLTELIDSYYQIQKNKEYLYYDMVTKCVQETGKRDFIQTLFQLQDFHFEGSDFMKDYFLTQSIAKYVLAVFVTRKDSSYAFSLNYDQSKFTDEDITRIFNEYCSIAQSVIESGKESICDLTGFGKQEDSFDFLF